MKNTIKNIIHEAYIFFSTPLAVHCCILLLCFKIIKQSVKESNFLKYKVNKNEN